MRIKSWDQFSASAKEIFVANPSKTRVCMKYRHCDGTVDLKVTDDSTVVTFRTDEQHDLKNVHQFNAWMLSRMTAAGQDD